MKRIALVVAVLMAAPASAGLFGPSNYDECILEHLKGVSSDVGARMVAEACRKKFPPKKPAEKAAHPDAPRVTDEPVSQKPGEFTDIRLDPAK